MLQQTTVETVIPYYERFLARFPTIRSLAEAPEEEVLKMWSGLGYYSRARNLQKAAKQVEALPSTVEELMKLPGVGRYTAGAVASIAFNRPAPILDGNVVRVLSRLYRIGEDPKSAVGQKVFWKKAEEALTPPYGNFNQALMELGATVCRPSKPLCAGCPIFENCSAFQGGVAAEYPKLPPRAATVPVAFSAAVIKREKDGQILLVRRADRGLLKKLWEFPMVEGDVERLRRSFGLTEPLQPLKLIKHSILNRRLTVSVYTCAPKRFEVAREHRWIAPSRLSDLPTSSMNQKILKAFLS